MRANLRIVLPAVVAVLFIGCDLEDIAASTAKFKEDFRHSYEMESGGRVSVESFNGSIEVVGWDRGEVEIAGTKYASKQEVLDVLKIDIVQAGDAIHVRAVRPSGRRGNMGVRFVVHAPRTVDLDRLESSNGSVTVRDIDGNARVKTSNGRITIAGLSGDLEATTSNGAVKLEDTDGSAVVRTSNGAINAEHVRGHFSAKSSNGSITAMVGGENEGGRPIELHSSNGGIKLTLEEQPASDVIASTSNASITIYAPPSLRADLKARTSNASVRTDFEVAVKGTQKKSRLEGKINGGGPLLDLGSSNGGIKLLEHEPEV